jgi:PTS system fructose-specific IIC component
MMKAKLREIQEALLSGVSYMLPFVISGGILIAVGFAIGGYDIPTSVAEFGSFSSTLFWVGKKAFALMTPVLGAYVAYSIADKPALCAGMVGGLLADYLGAGFLGALVAGIFAGYLVNELKKIPLPTSLRSLLPTLIIPVLSVLIMGLFMVYIIGEPIATLNKVLQSFLKSLQGGGLIALGIIQGCMLAFDMGGPFNKVAYAFAIAAAEAGNWAPMSANFVASMVPPLGIALACLMAKQKFTNEERGAVPGLFAGAFAMITEFAIPFAAADPLRVIPSLMAGSAVGATLSYLFGLTMNAPHGGLFVFFLCNNIPLFLVALLCGGLVTAACLSALKKTKTTE